MAGAPYVSYDRDAGIWVFYSVERSEGDIRVEVLLTTEPTNSKGWAKFESWVKLPIAGRDASDARDAGDASNPSCGRNS